MEATHIDFYTRHKISPVRQDISDLTAHFQRREALYRHLGIPPMAVRGRTVAEVGPGSGHNSVYTAALGPSRYVLVDGNPTGVADIKKLFEGFPDFAKPIEIVLSTLEDYVVRERFDFVFCEGLLSGVPNPKEILTKLGDMTNPGGVLVYTCVDHVSHFPETLRRVVAQRLIDPEWPLQKQVDTLLPVFKPHLARLQGMSRRHDDWIIDNLIHPGSIIPLINLPEGTEMLGDGFEFYACSPHFVSDWRWYKQLVGDDRAFNRHAVAQYWTNVHNLLDHRLVLPPASEEVGRRLYQLCTEARADVQRYEQKRAPEHMRAFLDKLAGIIAIVKPVAPTVADALRDAHDLLKPEKLDGAAIANSVAFGGLFGRGQQYFSLTKR